MPPATERYDGPDAIAAFLRASATGRRGRTYRVLPTRAGGSPARGMHVLTTNRDGSAVNGITRFLDDTLHRHFGLPDIYP